MAVLLLVFGFALPYLVDTVAQAGVMLVFIISIIVVGVMSIWLIVQHYYKNLFGPEGYLMYTLPVRPYQLLLSKFLTTVFWFNFMLGSALLMILLLARSMLTDSFLFQPDNWRTFWEILKGIGAINVNIIPLILAIYMGIALSTAAVRNKGLGIGMGIAVSILGILIYNWISLKVSGIAAVKLTVDGSSLINETSFFTKYAGTMIYIAISSVFSAVFFFITTFIMKNKLNLK
jgi:hypothetical protein